MAEPARLSLSGGGAASARILVVDDEVMIGKIVQRILEGHGFDVTVVSAPAQGLELIRNDPGAFDLLVTDVVMPGMSGTDLAARARELLPALRVLFMSGYPDDVQLQHGMSVGEVDLLAKPFEGPDLLAAVHRALGPRDPVGPPASEERDPNDV